MNGFIASPAFLIAAAGFTLIGVVVAVLWRNTSWKPREITPEEQRKELKGGSTDLLPSSKTIRWIFGGVAMLFVAIALIRWSPTGLSFGPPTPAMAWEFTKEYWLWILMVLVGLQIGFAFIKEDKPYAGVLKWAPVVTFVALFILNPVIIAARDTFLPTVVCPDISAHGARSCTLNAAWSAYIKVADGPESNGLQICFTPGGQFERAESNGNTLIRFRATSGALVKTYGLYPPDRACPSVL